LPPALLSRFDLLFLLLDKSNEANDKELAFHVANVHKFLDVPKSD
jgi:DNA replication licensing factor MCM7